MEAALPAWLLATWVTLKLAGLTTLILLLLGMPLAWWLAHTRSRWRLPIGAVVALPMVLPPTVLGFYLLISLAPDGPIGQLTQSLGLGTLAFTFHGLLLASAQKKRPQGLAQALHPGVIEINVNQPPDVVSPKGSGQNRLHVVSSILASFVSGPGVP